MHPSRSNQVHAKTFSNLIKKITFGAVIAAVGKGLSLTAPGLVLTDSAVLFGNIAWQFVTENFELMKVFASSLGQDMSWWTNSKIFKMLNKVKK